MCLDAFGANQGCRYTIGFKIVAAILPLHWGELQRSGNKEHYLIKVTMPV
jgi:hypothetical protein